MIALIQHFQADFLWNTESRPQNPEFRNNPENFHPWSLWSLMGAHANFYLLLDTDSCVKLPFKHAHTWLTNFWVMLARFLG